VVVGMVPPRGRPVPAMPGAGEALRVRTIAGRDPLPSRLAHGGADAVTGGSNLAA